METEATMSSQRTIEPRPNSDPPLSRLLFRRHFAEIAIIARHVAKSCASSVLVRRSDDGHALWVPTPLLAQAKSNASEFLRTSVELRELYADYADYAGNEESNYDSDSDSDYDYDYDYEESQQEILQEIFDDSERYAVGQDEGWPPDHAGDQIYWTSDTPPLGGAAFSYLARARASLRHSYFRFSHTDAQLCRQVGSIFAHVEGPMAIWTNSSRIVRVICSTIT